jgi:hypothetical protein
VLNQFCEVQVRILSFEPQKHLPERVVDLHLGLHSRATLQLNGNGQHGNRRTRSLSESERGVVCQTSETKRSTQVHRLVFVQKRRPVHVHHVAHFAILLQHFSHRHARRHLHLGLLVAFRVLFAKIECFFFFFFFFFSPKLLRFSKIRSLTAVSLTNLNEQTHFSTRPRTIQKKNFPNVKHFFPSEFARRGFSCFVACSRQGCSWFVLSCGSLFFFVLSVLRLEELLGRRLVLTRKTRASASEQAFRRNSFVRSSILSTLT